MSLLNMTIIFRRNSGHFFIQVFLLFLRFVANIIIDSVLPVYDLAGDISYSLATKYDKLPTRDVSLGQAEDYFTKALEIANSPKFGVDAREYFWEQLGKTKMAQKQDCAASEYYQQIYQSRGSQLQNLQRTSIDS